MEGDLYLPDLHILIINHFNPLPPHGGRPVPVRRRLYPLSFQSTPSAWRETIYGYIHSTLLTFQSTPSAWRETLRAVRLLTTGNYFNPLPPHGGRRGTTGVVAERLDHFNPLPPHGGRPGTAVQAGGTLRFQSTPSAWRETMYRSRKNHKLDISIHSLRMEGDPCFFIPF